MPISPNIEVFCTGNDRKYQNWRARKLDRPARNKVVTPVKMRNLSQPRDLELNEIISQCANNNMAIYEVQKPDSEPDENELRHLCRDLKKLCKRLGMHDAEVNRSQGDDGVVAIRVDNEGIGSGYIPYTNKALSWHTDGYYNAPDARIRGMVLHCVRDASEGGINELLDPELAYIRLRDENPNYIDALMHDEAMTIPENTDKRSAYRAPSVGPVFFVDEITGALNMRYSARTRNIIWRDDRNTDMARAKLSEILDNDPGIVRHKLRAGQGLISNNVLHNRTGFEDNAGEQGNIAGRLLYRLRYEQRVARNIQPEEAE